MAKKVKWNWRCVLFGHVWKVEGNRVYCVNCGLEQ